MHLPNQLSNREQVNYLITLGFDEQRNQIEAGNYEPSETWLPFLGECAVKLTEVEL